MACQDSCPLIFFNVPAGASLCLRVQRTAGTVQAAAVNAQWLQAGAVIGTQTIALNPTVPATLCRPLGTADQLRFDVRLVLAKQSAAQVEAEVIRDDGTRHGRLQCAPFTSGNKGSTQQCIVDAL